MPSLSPAIFTGTHTQKEGNIEEKHLAKGRKSKQLNRDVVWIVPRNAGEEK